MEASIMDHRDVVKHLLKVKAGLVLPMLPVAKQATFANMVDMMRRCLARVARHVSDPAAPIKP